MNLQYVFEKRTGAWAALSWRYDSGLVAGAAGSLEDALGLTIDQQTAIGLFCGSKSATLGAPLTADDCTPSNFARRAYVFLLKERPTMSTIPHGSSRKPPRPRSGSGQCVSNESSEAASAV
jgi:hypothetical protein